MGSPRDPLPLNTKAIDFEHNESDPEPSGAIMACKSAAAFFFAISIATSLAAKHPKIGEPAPDFTLKLVDGRTIKFADIRGDVIVLNFWATWCVPCRKELPALDDYFRLRYKNGLDVFAVTTEDSVPNSQLKGLFAAMAIPAVRSVKGPYAPLDGVPTSFVIDRAGVIRYAKAAAFTDRAELDRLLVPLLNEPLPVVPASPKAP